MSEKSIERLELIRQTVREVEAGLLGTPFTWGNSEYQSKEFILASLGYVLVTITKLRRGGHRLKQNARPVGKAYFNAPIKKYAPLYVLGEQTERELKWHDLYGKGRALLEAEHQFHREEYAEKRPTAKSAMFSLDRAVHGLNLQSEDANSREAREQLLDEIENVKLHLDSIIARLRPPAPQIQDDSPKGD